MKVRSDKDTTGYKKIKLLENLNISSSLQLSPTPISWHRSSYRHERPYSTHWVSTSTLRSIRIRHRRTRPQDTPTSPCSHNNKLVRLTSLGFLVRYSFQRIRAFGGRNGSNALPASATPEQQEFFSRTRSAAAEQQRLLSTKYYDFGAVEPDVQL